MANDKGGRLRLRIRSRLEVEGENKELKMKSEEGCRMEVRGWRFEAKYQITNNK